MPRRDPREPLRFWEQRADRLVRGASCKCFKPSKLDPGSKWQCCWKSDSEQISEDLHSFGVSELPGPLGEHRLTEWSLTESEMFGLRFRIDSPGTGRLSERGPDPLETRSMSEHA